MAVAQAQQLAPQQELDESEEQECAVGPMRIEELEVNKQSKSIPTICVRRPYMVCCRVLA